MTTTLAVVLLTAIRLAVPLGLMALISAWISHRHPDLVL
jgi:hypothetical protein